MVRKHRVAQAIVAFVTILPYSHVANGQVNATDSTAKANRYQDYALRNPGNVERGKALFNETRLVACVNCHSINGIEKSGPNLDGIADKYPRKDLIHHILRPNSFVQPGYETVNIVTEAGQVFTGRVRLSSRFEIRLLLADGRLKSIKRDEIADIKSSTVSMVASNLVDVISEQGLSDIVTYLETLRGEPLQALAGTGQPLDLKRSEEAIEIVPLHPASLKFENPVWVTGIPGQQDNLVVLEHQLGKAVRLDLSSSPPTKQVFLDLSEEISFSPNQGLMCLVFHPDYVNNRRYFVKYEVKVGNEILTTVNERKARSDGLADSGQPSRRLLQQAQPAFNHNGGCIAFGPDGKLYIGFGDGGPQKDPPGFSQNPGVFHGSLLRIDVDVQGAGLNYSIPADNPFTSPANARMGIRPETWAFGFREPWRFSFDFETGDLWIGDVGQVKYEEVCLVKRGENHGWNVKEGFGGFSTQYRRQGEVYTNPVLAYPRNMGVSVTGGYVYRGDPSSPFYGQYIFGDYESRTIWAMALEGGVAVELTEIAKATEHIASFGTDQLGNILMVGYEGSIFRLKL